MKKLILLLAAVALATSVWAQDTPKKPSFAGFVSNGFWDNWEITLGGGAGTALSNGTNQGSFGDRINFEANFGLTKWFHPVTGMRLQLQGGRFANFDDVLGKAKWPYLFVHADFMLNFCTLSSCCCAPLNLHFSSLRLAIRLAIVLFRSSVLKGFTI